MALAQRTVSPQLEATLARLCQRLGGMSMTKAVTLPYLIDVIAKKELGRQIANATYQCWRNGVVSVEVYKDIEHAPSFRVTEERYTERSRRVELVFTSQRLTSGETDVVDYVADMFGRINQEEIGLLTKRMNTHIPADKWGSNAQAELGDDAYYRLSEQWQGTCKRLAEIDFAKLDKGAKELRSATDLFRLVS